LNDTPFIHFSGFGAHYT